MRRFFSCRYKFFLVLFFKFGVFFDGYSSQTLTQNDNDLNISSRNRASLFVEHQERIIHTSHLSCLGKFKNFFSNFLGYLDDFLNKFSDMLENGDVQFNHNGILVFRPRRIKEEIFYQEPSTGESNQTIEECIQSPSYLQNSRRFSNENLSENDDINTRQSTQSE